MGDTPQLNPLNHGAPVMNRFPGFRIGAGTGRPYCAICHLWFNGCAARLCFNAINKYYSYVLSFSYIFCLPKRWLVGKKPPPSLPPYCASRLSALDDYQLYDAFGENSPLVRRNKSFYTRKFKQGHGRG